MKSMIAWAIRHSPAMNVILVFILLVGALSAWSLRREEFPAFELEIVLVTVPYPGASPEEVESGICQKIEEAVRSIDGIKKITSVAKEGSGNVVLEIKADTPDVQKVLGEVESAVDRIPTFPNLSEQPNVQQLTLRNPAITVGVVAQDTDTSTALELRDVTESVRDDLLLIPQISVADISGERRYQIDVEIPERTLREYDLTLTEVGQRIRRRNVELPAGNIKDQGNTYLLRGKNKSVLGEDIARLPLITQRDGVVLTVADLGTVKDEFVDDVSISLINGKPGLAVSVKAAAREDLLSMADAVKKYVANHKLPPGYEFEVWGDSSINVRDRLDLLTRNGATGLVLVFIVLAMFLEFRLAFWVALGIPVSILGACAVLWQFDQTLNMLSLFAFLIALGIVVDDAIVIGENIYAHRELGKPFLQAAIDGTVEVVPSVATSIATTIIVLVPMFFVSGIMGKFFAILPLAMIAMLVISLIESTFILPCHLAHGSSEPFFLTAGINRLTTRVLDFIITRVYRPLVKLAIRRPIEAVCAGLLMLIVSFIPLANGAVPRVFFPKLDAPEVIAQVLFPDGTPAAVTEAATERVENAIQLVNAEHIERFKTPLIQVVHRQVGTVTLNGGPGGGEQVSGGHVGNIHVQLVDNGLRHMTSQKVIERWRLLSGEIAGVETMTFASQARGPGGKPIEFKLLAPATEMAELEAAVEDAKTELSKFTGVKDIVDDSRPGKWEIQLTEKPGGQPLGVPLDEIARTVRASFYGEEVMRLQRGRHEVKLMVRYPEEDRRSLANLDSIRVETGDGFRRPLKELAERTPVRGYSEINRLNQRRAITVSADIDESLVVARDVVAKMQESFVDELKQKYPSVSIRWEGQQEQDTESIGSLFLGLGVALLVMYALLVFEFNSYLQPLVVMIIIPFGFVGAILGHYVMGLPLTLFSMLGMMALTGVVVNDSIVLVDFVNAKLRAGASLKDAVIEAGERRFRPVLLTSLTTVVGLFPILTETSFQAQLVIPMATSLCFGLMLSTLLVLVLVPTFFYIYGRTLEAMGWTLTQTPSPETSEPVEVSTTTVVA